MLVLGGLLVVGTGCPHDWMKGGTNDRAMAKDMREMVGDVEDEDDADCPEGMTLKPDCEHRLADGTCPLICK
jgi:hypothetical protein